MKLCGLLIFVAFGTILNAAEITKRSKFELHHNYQIYGMNPVNITKFETPTDEEFLKLSGELLNNDMVYDEKHSESLRQLKSQSIAHTTASPSLPLTTSNPLRSQNAIKTGDEHDAVLNSTDSTVSSHTNFETFVDSWLKVMTDILLIDTKLISIKKAQCNAECRNNTRKELKMKRHFLVKQLERFLHTSNSNIYHPMDVFKPKKFANRSKLPLKITP